MLPVTDIIPTRTPPAATIALIAVSILFWSLYIRGAAPVAALHALYLWLFGRTVEDRLGHLRFATLFVLCAATAWMLSTPADAVPGGVAGVIGAYFLLYPRSILLVLVPLPLLLVEVPAFVFLGFWLVLEMLTMAVWPQMVTLMAGALLCLVMKRPERVRVDWWSP
jgi:membrane associated rhomboid family serine protease